MRTTTILRDAQLALYLAGEAGWLYAWSVALGSWTDPTRGGLIGLPTLALLLLVAAVLTRAIGQGRTLSRAVGVAVALLGVAVALFLGFGVLQAARGDQSWTQLWQVWSSTSLGFRHLGVIALALLVWWRGLAAGRARLDLYAVQSTARGQILALVALFVLNTFAPAANAAPVGSLALAAMAVVFAGLVGMPFARVLDLRASERGRAGALGLNRQWLAMLLGAVAGLLLLALLLAAVLTFERVDQLLRPVGEVADLVLLVILYVVGIPLGFLLQVLLGLFQHLRLAPPGAMPLLQLQQTIQHMQNNQPTHAGSSDTLLEILKWATLTLLLIGVVVALARAASRAMERLAADEVDETRDFVWSWDEMKAILRDWLLGLLSRRRRPAVTPPTAPLQAPGVGAILDARALYRELLRLGAGLGRRRAPSETPLEYERALVQVERLSPSGPEVDLITAAYTRARYAPEEPSPSEVEAARLALERLRDKANEARSDGRVQ